jgi:tetratricopeptide (TPR) repeat protein
MRSPACLLAATLVLSPPAMADEHHHHHHHDKDPNKGKNPAQVHLDQGLELEGEGEFEMAIMEFQAAEKIVKDPEYALHIAECHESLGQVDDAIASYERYLEQVPPGTNVDAIKKHLDEMRVKMHTGEAKRLLDEKSYEKSLAELEAAEKVQHEPRRLYDIAVCLEGMNENARAAETYRTYLKEVPDTADAGEIEGRIKVLTGHHMAPAPMDALAAPPPPPPAWYQNKGAMGLAIGCVLLGAGSIAFFALSRSTAGDADNAHTEADWTTLNDRGHTFNWVSLGLGLASVAVLATAAVLFVRTARDRPAPRTTIPPPAAAAPGAMP